MRSHACAMVLSRDFYLSADFGGLLTRARSDWSRVSDNREARLTSA